VTAEAEWLGRRFTLVDTGGIALERGEKTRDLITDAMRRQAQAAIREAVAVIFVVDAHAGITPLDEEVAAQLRKSGRSVYLAVNKVDSAAREEEASGEFARLGFPQMFFISALHGRRVDELLDAVTQNVAAASQHSDTSSLQPSTPLSIAIIGRPNVGKSSLVNRLINEERLIVTDIPGTTRDAVDVPFRLKHGATERDCLLIDTAGIRPVGKVRDSVEVFSVMRAQSSIERCDVAVLVLDATTGVTAQDKKVGGKIAEAFKGCVIAVNKWDLMRDEKLDLEKCAAAVRRQLFFLNYAPIVFISALEGRGLEKLMDAVLRVDQQMDVTVQTAVLNRAIDKAMDSYQPPRGHGGKYLRVYYGNQVATRPPTLLLFVNDPGSRAPHYERYLADRLRQDCGFGHAPLKLIFRGRNRAEK
jgi:GTP-binding protein